MKLREKAVRVYLSRRKPAERVDRDRRGSQAVSSLIQWPPWDPRRSAEKKKIGMVLHEKSRSPDLEIYTLFADLIESKKQLNTLVSRCSVLVASFYYI